jgi:hypothetical protein
MIYDLDSMLNGISNHSDGVNLMHFFHKTHLIMSSFTFCNYEIDTALAVTWILTQPSEIYIAKLFILIHCTVRLIFDDVRFPFMI